ncbi:hypothetical protein STCU_11243 [Strigomonas culicis]|uniref:Uncharacterized protein n=1 Tax=Strigomonas culicis TaxID=28005 RepID=S9TEI1_9TRYP|nr:hypothetical protein STCU_11243 [Strigomonas culicis]|eukprot:EPY16462.1 hypothetical protein STCU_11243 [Strigomonas culicis]
MSHGKPKVPPPSLAPLKAHNLHKIAPDIVLGGERTPVQLTPKGPPQPFEDYAPLLSLPEPLPRKGGLATTTSPTRAAISLPARAPAARAVQRCWSAVVTS